MVKNNFLSSEMFRPLLFAVLLPLGLAAIGGIQFFFFTQSPATLAEIRQQLREEHSRLQSLPRGGQVPKVVPPSIKPGAPKGENGAVKPKDASRTPGGRRANQELANVAAALEIIEKELPFQTIRRFSSLLAMFAGLAASVLGMAGLAMIAYISPRAMQSREYLLAAFSRLRTVFPVLLMFQSTALVVAGVCVLVFLAAGAARGGKDEWRLLIASVLFILVFIGIGAVVIWRLIKALRSVFEPRAIALHGEDIDRADAPQLWQFVEDISRKAHSIVPDNIVLGLTHGFFVTACDITLDHGNRCISGKTLHLSLPQMAFLNRGETAAIIGHELGHFTGEDLEYSGKFLPIYSGAADNIEAVSQTMTTGHVVTDGVISMALVKPLMTLAVFFLDTFDKIVNHWSRIREFAADQVGIQTSGADASASALLRTSICAAVIDEVLNDAWEHPEAPTADLLAEMLQKAHENGLDDPQKHMEDMQPHPTDTHPPTRQRLEAMGQTYADTAFIETVVRKPEMAHSALTGLLPEPESLCRRLTEAFHSSAQQYQAEVDAALEEAIAKADEPPFALFERTWHLVTLMLGIAVIMFLVGIFSSMATGGKIIVMILGVVFLWGAWHYYKIGRNQPRVILTAGGFGSPSLAREVPWTDIEDYEIATSSGNTNTTTIKLMLHEKTVPPEPVKGIPGCKYNRKRHALSIMLHSLKKIEGKHVTGERIADELGKRLQAGHARVLLAERKKNRE